MPKAKTATCDGVAIIVHRDGRIESKAILQIYNDETVKAFCSLSGHADIEVIKVSLARTVFGGNAWLPLNEYAEYNE